MANYDVELEEYKGKLTSQINSIQKILNLNTDGLLEDEIKEKLIDIKSRAQKLKNKLEKNEFEISIVGLEKSGKSSFANALMGCDILPSKEARCTYTSTSIKYANENKATVKFFSNEEFEKDFQEKLKSLGIENSQMYTYETLTLEIYENLFENLDERIKNYYGGTINKDIEDILRFKDNISKFVGSYPKEFNGKDELESEYFKGFIEKPQYAIAVKEITIYSDKLEKMRNAIIYDVPGFDSPTQMHKEQTLDKMRAADAIILIAQASKPSFTGSVVDIFRKESDDDGVRFGDKMFVFANMADKAENLANNIEEIKGDLKRHLIMGAGFINKRVLVGSARARLEREGKVEGKLAIEGLKRNGIDDGIDNVINELEKYNKTQRFEVIKGRINRLQSDIRQLFENKFKDDNREDFIDREKTEVITQMLDESRLEIREQIEKYRDSVRREYACEDHKLTDKLKKEIDEITVEKYGVQADEIEKICNRDSSAYGVKNMDEVDAIIRESKRKIIFNDFSDKIVKLAIDEHGQCEKKIEEIFLEVLKISENNIYYHELKENIREFITKQKSVESNSGYYKSLIERFSLDLFEILIRYSYGHISRWNFFERKRADFYSLSMYSDDFDNELLPGEQPMCYKILLHEDKQAQKSESIKKALKLIEGFTNIVVGAEIKKYLGIIAYVEGDKVVDDVKHIIDRINKNISRDNEEERVNSLKNLLENIAGNYEDKQIKFEKETLSKEMYEEFFNGKRDKNADDLREEINMDIQILQDMLNKVVVNAIRIEVPFLAVETQTMNNIIDGVNGRTYREFINNNIHKICADEYSKFEGQEQKQRAYASIKELIKEILNEMTSTEYNR